MTTEEVYHYLVSGSRPNDCDEFDGHVLGSVLALAFYEAQTGQSSIGGAVGLDRPDLSRLLDKFFPHAAALFVKDDEAAPTRSADEITLIDLLNQCGTTGSPFEALLAPMIARRAQRPNHLWQDLGLQDRGELSELMTKHFAPLAARNNKDMKWKKFLYRTICRDTGYALCVAPSCGECADFDHCFNEETGESFLARIRRDVEASA